MNEPKFKTLDTDTIKTMGLRLSENPMNSETPTAVTSRVFEYPHLQNVFIMESDLYGNPMPPYSCFLAYNGNHGLMGQHLTIETLRSSSIEDIRKMVESNSEG